MNKFAICTCHAASERTQPLDPAWHGDGCAVRRELILAESPLHDGLPQAVAFLIDGKVMGFEVAECEMEAAFGHAELPQTWETGSWRQFFSTGDASITIRAKRWRRLNEDRWAGFRSLQQELNKAAAHLGEKIPGEWRLKLKHLDDAESTYRVTITPGGGMGLSPTGIIEELHSELDRILTKAIARWRQDRYGPEPEFPDHE